jgi:uracil-DNA glycosylase family 4
MAGIGNLDNPRVIVVGDAPAKEEAAYGRSFGDDRARLLIEALEEVGIPVGGQGQVLATYAAKCFPAGKLKAKDVKTCADAFLLRELDHYKPELVLALGKNAQLAVTGSVQPLSKTHGRLVEVERPGWTMRVMSVEHPFSILTTPAKKDQWLADFWRARVFLYSEGDPVWNAEKASRFDFQVIESAAHFKQIAKDLIRDYRGEYLALDIEASGLDEHIWQPEFKVFTLQFGVVDVTDDAMNDVLPVYILPIQSSRWACSASGGDMWRDTVRDLLNNFLAPRYFKLVAHNGKYDLKGLRRVGVDKAFLDRDTMILWAAVHGEAPASLKEIAYQVTDLGGYEKVMEEYFKEYGTYDAPPELLTLYGGLDIVVTRHLMYHLHHTILQKDKKVP